MRDKSSDTRMLVLSSTFPRWKNDVEPPFVHNLSQHLLATGFTIDVLAPHTAKSLPVEKMDGLTVYRYRYSLDKYEQLAYNGGILSSLKNNRLNYLLVPFFLFAQFFNTWRLVKSGDYQVVHAHWMIPQGLSAAIAIMLAGKNKPLLICTAHGSDVFSLNAYFFKCLKQWLLKRTDLLTVVSNPVKQYCLSQLNTDVEIAVCPMGVDLKHAFTPAHAEYDRQNKLIFVGRLVKGKGLEHLIQALAMLRQHNSEAHLDIVGDGPERGSIETLVHELGLEQSVRFHGAVANKSLPDYFRRAAIAVIPSDKQEGFGLVAVEALGCECAVVASSFEAIDDVFTDGEHGLLCPPGDSACLARSIQSLLDDPDLRVRMARQGREHVVARFDWRVIASKYAQLIENKLKK